jgi:hypothetical protein
MSWLNSRAAVVAPQSLLIFALCFFQRRFMFAFFHSHLLSFVCFTLSLSARSLLLTILNTNMQPLALSEETNSYKQSDGTLVMQSFCSSAGFLNSVKSHRIPISQALIFSTHTSSKLSHLAQDNVVRE